MRGKGNPIEILEKTSQSEPHPSPHLRKSWKKPRNLSPVLAPTAGTPGNPGKNLTICGPSPGPPEILEKTSQFADRRRDRRKSWKKTSQYYGFAWLLLLVPTSCAEAPCGGNYIHKYTQPDMHACIRACKNTCVLYIESMFQVFKCLCVYILCVSPRSSSHAPRVVLIFTCGSNV